MVHYLGFAQLQKTVTDVYAKQFEATLMNMFCLMRRCGGKMVKSEPVPTIDTALDSLTTFDRPN